MKPSVKIRFDVVQESVNDNLIVIIKTTFECYNLTQNVFSKTNVYDLVFRVQFDK